MRLAALRQRLVDEGLDAILITHPANRYYLSGFTGSIGTLIISHDRAMLATRFIYYEQAEKQSPQFELFRITQANSALTELLPGMVNDMGIRRLGFESEDVTAALYLKLIDMLPEGVELVATSGLVEEMRAIKDQDELTALRRAIAVGDAAFAYITDLMRPGITERQLAWELSGFMQTHGAEAMSFEPIVAAGPRSAMPHASPTHRAIETGEPVVMDFGATVDGYCSDLTRTVIMGRADRRYKNVYQVVLEAQQEALRGILPGMTGRQADAIARRVIVEAGYVDAFGHGLGHGVGLSLFERPIMAEYSDQELQPGMVFAIEPGIYLSGAFGVRLEDVVLLHEDGLEQLSQAAKDPILTRV